MDLRKIYMRHLQTRIVYAKPTIICAFYTKD